MPSRLPPSSPPDRTENARFDAGEPHGVSRRRMLAGALGAHFSPPASIALLGTADRPCGHATEFQPDSAADAELLRLCALVCALDAEEISGDDTGWADALRQVSERRPTSLAGLHAKVRLALLMMPFGSAPSCPDWVSPDERLTWSLLRDLLALSTPDGP